MECLGCQRFVFLVFEGPSATYKHAGNRKPLDLIRWNEEKS